MKVVIIDYWMWNVWSVLNMVKKVWGEGIISNKKSDILSATKLILPWVWHFKKWMEQLQSYDLVDVIKQRVVEDKIPILWICLWYQLLSLHSEEWNVDGLWLINANVKKFDLRLLREKWLMDVHMWWNCVWNNKKSKLFDWLSDEVRFYFVHSFYFSPVDENDILTYTNYWIKFSSSIEKWNIYWVQFHPEKSHKFWQKLISNFIFNV